MLQSSGSTDDRPSASDTTGSAEEVSSFVEQLAREYFADAPDRRSESRYRITLPITAQRVNDNFQTVGANVPAVTRDLSAGGIGLICQDPLGGNIIVQLTNPSGGQLRVLAKVLRCVPNGYYYDVGCRFLTEF